MPGHCWQVLLRRVPEARPAVVHGFRRFRIRQQVFPAMIPAEPRDEAVRGLVRGFGV